MVMDRIALILTIIGALNWGSIGIFSFDIVAWLFGGQGGLPNAHYGKFPDGSQHTIAAEKVPAGTITVQRTSGGGGWGDPAKRDRKLIEWDVLNGYVSIEAAKREYGVTIDPETMKIVED